MINQVDDLLCFSISYCFIAFVRLMTMSVNKLSNSFKAEFYRGLLILKY